MNTATQLERLEAAAYRTRVNHGRFDALIGLILPVEFVRANPVENGGSHGA